MVGKGEGETDITGSALPLLVSFALWQAQVFLPQLAKKGGGHGYSPKMLFGRTEIIPCGWELKNGLFVKSSFLCIFSAMIILCLRSMGHPIIKISMAFTFNKVNHPSCPVCFLKLTSEEPPPPEILRLCFFPLSPFVSGAYSWLDFKTRDFFHASLTHTPLQSLYSGHVSNQSQIVSVSSR